jgi:hypothetical protein
MSEKMKQRKVEDQEKKFPHLSIVYRVYAQQEVWVLHDLHDVNEYFRAFGMDKPIPELTKDRNPREALVNPEQVSALAKKVMDELTYRKDASEFDVDHRHHMPFLTQTYRDHIVSGPRFRGYLPSDRKFIEHNLIAELLGLKLVW